MSNIAGLALEGVFQLPDNPSSTPYPGQVIYRRLNPTGGYSISTDSKQDHQFNVRPLPGEWFIPSRSYFEFEITSQVPNTPPAPNAHGRTSTKCATQLTPFAIDNIVENLRISLGGTIVSQMSQDIGYIAHMKHRTSKSRDELNNLCQAGFPYHSQFSVRTANQVLFDRPTDQSLANGPTAEGSVEQVSQIGPEGVATNAANIKTTVSWTPPSGFFDIQHGIPKMDCVIEFTTKNSWNFSLWEPALSNLARINSTGATPPRYAIADDDTTLLRDVKHVRIIFKAAFVRSEQEPDSKFILNFNEWECQRPTYASPLTTSGGGNARVEVRPDVEMIGFATSDSRGDSSNIVSGTRFLQGIQMTSPLTAFKGTKNIGPPDNAQVVSGPLVDLLSYYQFYADSNGIYRMQMEYNGQLFPQYPLISRADWQRPELDLTALQTLPGYAQRMGRFNGDMTELLRSNYINQGGDVAAMEHERLEDFLSLGQYYCWTVPKDGTSHATTATFLYERKGISGKREATIGDSDWVYSTDLALANIDTSGLAPAVYLTGVSTAVEDFSQILVFSRSPRSFMIRTQDSMVMSVMSSADSTASAIPFQ